MLTFDPFVIPLSIAASNDSLAVALVDGTIQIHNLETKQHHTLNHHKEAVRCVEFLDDLLFSGSSDQTIQLYQEGNIALVKQLDAPINAMAVKPNLVACGDDDGQITVFDLRSDKQTIFNAHADTITDMLFINFHLACCSGDGSLTVHDVRKSNKPLLFQIAESFDYELLSLTSLATTLYSGTSLGKVNYWDYKKSEECNCFSLGSTVDSLCTWNNSLVAGLSNGSVCLVDLKTKKKRIIGTHEPKMSIDEVLVFKNEVISCSHDGTVRFHSINKGA